MQYTILTLEYSLGGREYKVSYAARGGVEYSLEGEGICWATEEA